MAYLYIVTDNSTKAKRLIEASSPANAVAFVAKESFTTTRVTAEVADMINLPLEKVTGENPAPMSQTIADGSHARRRTETGETISDTIGAAGA